MIEDSTDPILCHLRRAHLFNGPHDRVKVMLNQRFNGDMPEYFQRGFSSTDWKVEAFSCLQNWQAIKMLGSLFNQAGGFVKIARASERGSREKISIPFPIPLAAFSLVRVRTTRQIRRLASLHRLKSKVIYLANYVKKNEMQAAGAKRGKTYVYLSWLIQVLIVADWKNGDRYFSQSKGTLEGFYSHYQWLCYQAFS